MEIRPERPSDSAAISAVITAAFLEAEHSSGTEATIVEALRDAGCLTISLVAVAEEAIVGHVGFSSVTLDGIRGGWFGLGPLAVLPGHRRCGVGQALVAAGLDLLRAQGAAGCVVLGDPAYYSRFGFAADQQVRLDGVPPAYFQHVLLAGPPAAGSVSYHPAFAAG